MNREQQIEEMAKTLCEDYGECKKCTLSNPECENPCTIKDDCEMLYNAGYRLAREVAVDVFEWLEQKGYLNIEGWAYYNVRAELKKKYEVKNNAL